MSNAPSIGVDTSAEAASANSNSATAKVVNTAGNKQFRFQPEQRLLTKRDYGFVFEQARRVRDDTFTVLARKSAGPYGRLGLAISKRELRRAVDRNRIKRLARESFRLNQEALQGYDIVVMCRKTAQNQSSKVLLNRLSSLWIKAVSAQSRSGKRRKNKPA